MKAENICIVGGGTSGWMLAVALEKHNPDINVTLVESPRIGNIGVGESTIPTVANFIKKFLGFDEEDWMAKCDAVYKTSIKFNNFKEVKHTAYHPFWNPIEKQLGGHDWSIKKALDPDNTTTDDYYNSYYSAIGMSKTNKFSKSKYISHAHHLDSTKFGMFCKDNCTNINHIIGHIEDVVVKDDHIKELILKGDRIIESDLFVDCTGFSALLIGKAMKNEFEPSTDYLLNDRAIFNRLEYTNDSKKDELEPYTDCTALSSGWAWNIPLWSRVGTGYVYSSKYLTEEEASDEFYKYLSDRFGVDRVNKSDFNHIKVKAGKYKKAWINNCTSLVLSSGFVEPLESTGLALMAKQVEHLVSVLNDGHFNSLDISNYNNFVDKSIQEVVDFVSLHYTSSNREDSPYWKYINRSVAIPKTLVDRLYKINTGRFDMTDSAYFPIKSWESILIGLGVTSSNYYGIDDLAYYDKQISLMSVKEKKATLQHVTTFLQEQKDGNDLAVSKMMNHFEYLNKVIYN